MIHSTNQSIVTENLPEIQKPSVSCLNIFPGNARETKMLYPTGNLNCFLLSRDGAYKMNSGPCISRQKNTYFFLNTS